MAENRSFLFMWGVLYNHILTAKSDFKNSRILIILQKSFCKIQSALVIGRKASIN